MFGFPILEFIYLVLGFGFLIFVHELGHFAVAKWVGIRCPQFAIGFGKAAVSWRKGIGFMRGSTEAEYEKRCLEKLQADGVKPEAKGPHTGTARFDDIEVKEEHESVYTGRQMFAVGDELGLGETEYRLNWLPLGGYVKMLGQEDMDPNAQSDDPRAYNNKPIWARACVISAGVVMNMIFGAIFLAIAFSIGVSFPAAKIGGSFKGMPAASTYAEGHDGDPRYLGLRHGDDVISVNGKPAGDFTDVRIAGALGSSGGTVEVVVQRRGEKDHLTYNLPLKRANDSEKLLSIGVEPGPKLEIVAMKQSKEEIADWYRERIEKIPAAKRQPGDGIAITAVNGKAIDDYDDYLLAFDNSNGKPVSVTFTDQADDTAKTFDLSPSPTLVPHPELPDNLLGLVPAGKITMVAEGSPAEEAGLKEGDLLIKVGDAKLFNDVPSLAKTIMDNPDQGFEFEVLRDGKVVSLGTIEPDKDGKFGIAVTTAFDTPVVALVLDEMPGKALDQTDGFMRGTKITQVNGQPVDSWTQLQQRLLEAASGDNPGESIELTLQLPHADSAPERVTLSLSEDDRKQLTAAGWSPDHTAYFPVTDYALIKAESLGEAFAIGADKTKDFVVQTYVTLLRLIQGDVKIYNLRGPVGIISTGTQVAKQGVPYLLYFLGLISINLAVINFLPIPIVDGGHMVFLAWEKITGKPPSEKVQIWSLYAGLAIIGFVFIATFYFDMMREITKFF